MENENAAINEVVAIFWRDQERCVKILSDNKLLIQQKNATGDRKRTTLKNYAQTG